MMQSDDERRAVADDVMPAVACQNKLEARMAAGESVSMLDWPLLIRCLDGLHSFG